MFQRLILMIFMLLVTAVGVAATPMSNYYYCYTPSDEPKVSKFISILAISGSMDKAIMLDMDTSISPGEKSGEFTINSISQKTLLSFRQVIDSQNLKFEGLFQGEYMAGICTNISSLMRESVEALESEMLTQVKEALELTEAARLVEAAATQALRTRLLDTDTELTKMALALEEQHLRTEDMMMLLAAAEMAKRQASNSETEKIAEIERQSVLLEQTNYLLEQASELLTKERVLSAEGQRIVELLNQQISALRTQLNSLQGLLNASKDKEAEQKVRAELEAKELERLQAEADSLRSSRSELFGRVREILGGYEGVHVVGDRIVLSSDVLFSPESVELSAEGVSVIATVAAVIRDIGGEIPYEINWVLRVDGHTEKTGVGPSSAFADNWELSQAFALSVVRYFIDREGIPANRLAAAGFGEFQPLELGDSPESMAMNRRIEIRLTEE